MVEPLPMYEQLRRTLESRIVAGDLSAGERLPSEMELCESFGVSRTTVREALGRLADADMVMRKRGMGTFVRSHAATPQQSSTRTRTVSLVLANAQGGFMADLVKGAEQVLYHADYRLSVTVCHDSLEQERDRLDQLIEHPVDGVILFTVNAQSEHYPNCGRILALQEAGAPVLLVDRYITRLPVGYVVADDEAGMYALTHHVLERGHRRIGYLDDTAQASSVIGRRQGFVRAMAEHGVRLDPSLILNVPMRGVDLGNDVQRAQALVQDYLDQRREIPQAIIACTTSFAIGAWRAFRHRGIRVPQDVAMASWGDDSAAVAGHVFQSILQAPVEAMGRRVAEELLKLIENGDSGENVRVRLPGKLMTHVSELNETLISSRVTSR